MALDPKFLNFKHEDYESNRDNIFAKDYLWEEMKYEIRTSIVPSFWSCFKLDCNKNNDPVSENLLKTKQFYQFVETVKTLNANFQKMLDVFFEQSFTQNCKINSEFYCMELKIYLREALLSQIPIHFEKIVYSFYFISFQVFSKVYSSSEADAIDDVRCSGCQMEESPCRCQELTKSINDVNQILIKLDLLDRITGQTITSLVQEHIEDYIANKCQGIFDKSHLKEIERWIQSNIINWLTRIFNNGLIETDRSNVLIRNIVQGFEVKLTYFLYEHFALSLIKNFFSIIIDFPDSTPAIDDLKICMEKIDVRKVLIDSIKTSLEKRILHPGVNTKDILTGYVAAIKTIRHLDPSGVILETVTEPIKNYLRKRTDTVRCVVTSLTEEGPTDLSEELAKGEIQKDYMESSTTIDQKEWERWLPDTFFIQYNKNENNTKKVRSADIISMVVDIYGSKELFMNEYRNLMADRLLSLTDHNTDKELRNLELLKLRFGDTLLHSCEVMLKDIADSKRINSHIQNDPEYIGARNFDISSLIISAQFWPSFNKESLELPADIEKEFKQYTKSYEAYKGNRTLSWRTVTGRVNIQIEIGRRILDLSVSPTHAIIIYHFQNQNQWGLSDLSNVMKVPQSVLRRRIGFWKTYGLLQEISQDVFKVIEEEKEQTESMEISVSQIEDTDEDIESAMASASDQREEELQVFWSYIVGMLTNLDSLPIERIHQMLKLFASNGLGVEFSQDELKDFLQRKVREHKLLFSGGVYQLLK